MLTSAPPPPHRRSSSRIQSPLAAEQEETAGGIGSSYEEPNPIPLLLLPRPATHGILSLRRSLASFPQEETGGGRRPRAKMVLWVFGYGSLIWNPGFDFDDKILGFIKGYKRTFNLACIDHRGTPEEPARTCTLESDDEAVCWGIAYCVNGGLEKEREAMQYLERRECEYDQKISVNFYKDGNSLEPAVTGVLVFVSTPDPVGNKYYLGPAPLENMARQIATANGPTGNNRDYLFSMEKALSNISHEDDAIIELANEVRKVLSRSNEKKITGSGMPLKSHTPLVHVSPLPEGTVVDSR